MKKLIAVLVAALALTAIFTACGEEKTADIENIEAVDAGNTQFALGVTSEDTYTNNSLGITFTKPEGWIFYTDEEIAEIMNATEASVFADETLLDSINMTTLTDFMVMDPATGDSVSLMFENLSATGNEELSASEYADIGEKMLKEQLEVDGMKFGERVVVRLGDADFLRMSSSFSISGIELTQWQYIRKAGDFVAVIGTTTVSGRTAEDFEAMFSK